MKIEKINEFWLNKVKNKAEFFDKKIVLGNGNVEKPKLVIVGEAPGKQETETGVPFVGKAGKNLDSFLELADIKREECYITNIVKIRPYVVSEKGTFRNRAPSKTEVDFFLPWVFDEINILKPSVVVCLGNTPLKALCGEEKNVGSFHGKVVLNKGNTAYFSLYHPAALIYNRSLISQMHEDLNNLKTIFLY